MTNTEKTYSNSTFTETKVSQLEYKTKIFIKNNRELFENLSKKTHEKEIQ